MYSCPWVEIIWSIFKYLFRVESEELDFCGKFVKNLKTVGTYQFTKIVENDCLGLFFRARFEGVQYRPIFLC